MLKNFETFEKDEITIGRKDADPTPTICLTGLGVQKFHALIKKTDDGFKISPGASNAKVKINGVPITSEVCLNNKDRVVLGSNHVYVFCGKFFLFAKMVGRKVYFPKSNLYTFFEDYSVTNCRQRGLS